MDKRGEGSLMSLEFLIPLIYKTLIFLVVVGITFLFVNAFIKEKPSQVASDFDRILKNIPDVGLNDERTVFTQAQEQFSLTLLPPGNDQKECAGSPCLCLIESAKSPNCKIVAALSECNKGHACLQKNLKAQTVAVDPGQGVSFCSRDGILGMGKCPV
jgi:hypothetical protein